MSYLNLDLNYLDHPKTRRLIGILGRGAEVLPIKLWIYCGKFHAESGRLTGYATNEIESICDWWGKESKMVEAMLKVGYLANDGDDFLIPDWEDHQGHIVAFKKRAKSAAKTRWGKYSPADSSNATSNAKSEVKQCPNQTNHTRPNLLKPNQQGQAYPKPLVFQDQAIKTLKKDISEKSGCPEESEYVGLRADEIIREVANTKDVNNPIGLARHKARTQV